MAIRVVSVNRPVSGQQLRSRLIIGYEVLKIGDGTKKPAVEDGVITENFRRKLFLTGPNFFC